MPIGPFFFFLVYKIYYLNISKVFDHKMSFTKSEPFFIRNNFCFINFLIKVISKGNIFFLNLNKALKTKNNLQKD